MPVTEKFRFTRKPQEAVVVTTVGFTGGMGDPMIDPATGFPRWHKGFPVCVDSGEFEDVIRDRLPSESSGRLLIILTGLVKLRFRIGRNWSVPGLRFQGYWEVRVLRLDGVEVRQFESEEKFEIDPRLFFSTLREISNVRPFDPDRIAALTGVALTESVSPEPQGARIFTGSGGPRELFSRVEICVPAARPGARGVRAILEVGQALSVTLVQVCEEYGCRPVALANEGTPDLLMCLDYPLEGCSIRFRFPAQGPDRLAGVILDAGGVGALAREP